MNEKPFDRKYKEDRPVLAICYDFDKTLTPVDMQAQGYIQSVGYDVADFWRESNELAANNDMDQNLAYMYKMIEKAQGRLPFTRQMLEAYGAQVTLFPGVEDWFQRIRSYGASHGVIVEHYIISSGLKEMIEGTAVAKSGAFERVYASSFYFDDAGIARWPAQVVNYTNKTQFLFRIEKGVLDVNDFEVNDHFPPDQIRVPFRNMVYIGDSDTDVPCMKLVNSYGGHSIGVYDGEKTKVQKMIRDGRIRYYAAADYTQGSELDSLVKLIIQRTAYNEGLEAIAFRCDAETAQADKVGSDEQHKMNDLIITLENSDSFARTHEVIGELAAFTQWDAAQRQQLLNIALRNSQVRYILQDEDVKRFYSDLLRGETENSESAQKVREALAR